MVSGMCTVLPGILIAGVSKHLQRPRDHECIIINVTCFVTKFAHLGLDFNFLAHGIVLCKTTIHEWRLFFLKIQIKQCFFLGGRGQQFW